MSATDEIQTDVDAEVETLDDENGTEDTETVETVETVEEKHYSDLTPYAASLVLTKAGRKRGWKSRRNGVEVEFEARPQWMYRLASDGVIASNHAERKAAAGGGRATEVMFEGAAFAAWLRAFIDAKESGIARVRSASNASIMSEYEDF